MRSVTIMFLPFLLLIHVAWTIRTRLSSYVPLKYVRESANSPKSKIAATIIFYAKCNALHFSLCHRHVCVCVCACLCACVCMPRLWTSGNCLRYRRRFSFKLLGMTPDIICNSLTQIGLQIPRWRTKWLS